ncbi:MAG TPA: type II toxin-antitoxin system RelE/ParE family toxin [Rhizomicrobium sp.]|jgi:toxin ParE1/3/4|nr:type II toxin-antitoxin system RelE/ParE family toxin [Rhizomicrobium sp.]
MRIAWTAPALRDLGSIRAFVAQGNPMAALRQVEIILSAAAGLSDFPHSGRRAGTRELVLSRTPYLIAYRVRGHVVQILRVLHGRQRWPVGL